jgi:hypothetical protein
MPTITVRRLDADYEPVHGQGQNDFISDTDAVAQIIGTRLRLLYGEWWENQADGLPLFQEILGGRMMKDDIDALIQTRILGTDYVTGIESFTSSKDGSTREYSFACYVTTEFGTVTVSSEEI